MRRVLAATLICSLTLLQTACTDSIEDTPATPEQPDAAEELDAEVFPHESWMDRTVKPGDSFWDFAIGSWLKNHAKEDYGIIRNLSISQTEKLINGVADYGSPNHTMKLIQGTMLPTEEQKAEYERMLARLKPGNDISKADVMRNIGKMADMGFNALMGHNATSFDGIIRYFVMPGLYSFGRIDVTKDEIRDSVRSTLGRFLGMDTSTPETARLIETVTEIDNRIHEFVEKWMFSNPRPALTGHNGPILISTPIPASVALARGKTRQTGDDEMTQAFREAFHIDSQTYYIPEVDQIFDLINEFDVASLQTYLKYYLARQLQQIIFDDDTTPAERYAVINELVPSLFVGYHKDMLQKDADCEGARQMMEELRMLFAGRIKNSSWLSSATKQKALEKLQAMRFNIGAPEHLFNADFRLTGKTPIEDVMQYKEQADFYLRNVLPGCPAKDHIWELFLLDPTAGAGVDAVNAFYNANSNELVILYAFVRGELFPSDKNSVMRYVTLMVFGHEMTHGFDSMGAMFDAIGNKADWWTAEDKDKFEQLQQMIVDRFNELEQLPGLPANGEKTKMENMADLGGFSLAWEMWNRKLMADGLSGEQLRYQQRLFMLEYVHLWQQHINEKELPLLLEFDTHSANHNRINGILRLTDEWYELFGVKPGDKLYVKPEDRPKIW